MSDKQVDGLFGPYLEKVRHDNGRTRKSVCKVYGCRHQVLFGIERSIHLPSATNLLQLYNAYGIEDMLYPTKLYCMDLFKRRSYKNNLRMLLTVIRILLGYSERLFSGIIYVDTSKFDLDDRVITDNTYNRLNELFNINSKQYEYSEKKDIDTIFEDGCTAARYFKEKNIKSIL